MKYHNKNNYSFSPEIGVPVDFVNKTMTVDCLHCGRKIEFFVPSDFVDWESIAGEYMEMHQKTLERFNQMMTDMDAIYGTDNPAATYFRNKILMIKLDIEKDIRDGKF